MLAASVARGIEVGQVVFGADWLHARHRTTAVVGEVRVAARVDVIVPGLLQGPRHVGGGASKLWESVRHSPNPGEPSTHRSKDHQGTEVAATQYHVPGSKSPVQGCKSSKDFDKTYFAENLNLPISHPENKNPTACPLCRSITLPTATHL